jgi:hypothetical protein
MAHFGEWKAKFFCVSTVLYQEFILLLDMMTGKIGFAYVYMYSHYGFYLWFNKVAANR